MKVDPLMVGRINNRLVCPCAADVTRRRLKAARGKNLLGFITLILGLDAKYNT